MSVHNNQASWRAPHFSNPKLEETRTFTIALDNCPSSKKGWGEDFLSFKRVQFEAGHSIQHPSNWSLVIVACGHNANPGGRITETSGGTSQRFLYIDANFIGLFLDELTPSASPSDCNGNSLAETEEDYEFIARYTIEVLDSNRDQKCNEAILSRAGETHPRSKISEGFWGWRKVGPVPFDHWAKMELELRVCFTLIGQKKDELLRMPSSHANLLKNEYTTQQEIASALYSLIKGDQETDAEIYCRNIRRVFHVHRDILSARSSVFLRMFDCGLAESQSKKVTIEELRMETVEYLLRHLYTGQVEIEWLINPQIASELVYASEKYWLGSLRSFCDLHLVQAANRKNCLRLLELASLHDLEKATDDLTKFVHDKMRLESQLEEEQEFNKQNLQNIKAREQDEKNENA